MSKTTENIIVITIMVAIVIGLLCFVGYDNVKDWLSEPFVWKEPDFLTIEYVGALEKNDNPYLFFEVYNSSGKEIDSYNFQIVAGKEVLKFGSLDLWKDIDAYGFTTLEVRCNKWNIPEGILEHFQSMSSSDIENIECRVVELNNGSDTLFSNNGTIKIITILVASLALGLLGLVNKFPVWLRIVLKVCGLPIVLCLLVPFLFAKGKGDSSETQSSNDSQYSEAQQRYKRAANQKAGAISAGNRHSAAKAQEEMDRAMADMITAKGSGYSSAKEAYKRAANWKAGATINGRAGDAARAQAVMDRAMADMIKSK